MATKAAKDPKDLEKPKNLDDPPKETPEAEDEECLVFKQFKVLSRLRISKWEKFYHVNDVEENRQVALVQLNKEEYIRYFTHLIEEHGDWDDEKEIPKLAEKKFEEVDQQFGERYGKLMDLPPHRCLPKILDVHYDKVRKQYYAVLEYTFGVPFLLAAYGLTPLQKLGLAKELLEGLDHMHEHEVLHRRIKPGNIYVYFEGEKPTAKLTSWGLGVSVDKAQGDRSGTPKYVAPEVLLKGKITDQADLWSWAALLYHALTGEPPHSAREEAESLEDLENIVKEEGMPNELKVYGAFQKLAPHIEEVLKIDKLQELLFECLKPNPGERAFKNARTILDFIAKHWPMVMKGAPESEESITVSTN